MGRDLQRVIVTEARAMVALAPVSTSASGKAFVEGAEEDSHL